MLIFRTAGISCSSILELQIVRLRKLCARNSQETGVLLLEGLADHEVHMMESHRAVIGQRILYQSVRIFVVIVYERLIFLGLIHTVTLNPCRIPHTSLYIGRAIRKIEFIRQTVILALNTDHLQKINICRSRSHETVYDRVTGQHIIVEQRVSSRDIAMNCIIIHAITHGIMIIGACSTHHIVEHPCAFIVSLDGRLNQQRIVDHRVVGTIQSLHIRGIRIGTSHTVLI